MRIVHMALALCFLFLAIPAPISAKPNIFMKSVFVHKIEGGSAYRVIDKGNGKRSRKELKGFMSVKENSIIELNKGTELTLSCAGCSTVTIYHSDSPYRLQLKNFTMVKAGATQEVVSYFWDAVKKFVKPDSAYSPSVNTNVRKVGNTIWPSNGAKVVQLENLPVILMWEGSDSSYSIELIEDGNGRIYFTEVQTNNAYLPADLFSPDKEYKWKVIGSNSGLEFSSSFRTITGEESEKVNGILNDIIELLPPDTAKETEYRLQAGFLYSRGYKYNVMQLMQFRLGR